jgi:putative ABC transport system substrate-binding protein
MRHPSWRRPTAALVAAMFTLSACAGATTSPGANGTPGGEEMVNVSMAIIVNNLPVDQNLEGFKTTMQAAGYVEGTNINYVERNAFGKTADSDLIAKQTVDDEPDAIYVVGTPIVIAIHNHTDTIPVVFSLMTDPVGGGVVDSFEEPGGNFTGTSDAISPPVYFDTIEAVLPDCETVGIIGNTGEQNSASQIQQFTGEAEGRGFEVQVAPTATTNDVVPAIRSLIGRIDCLLVGADGTVDAAFESVIQTANDANLPLIMSGSDFATSGALIGIGPDFKALGVKSAEILIEILKGTKPADIPVVDALAGGGLTIAINAQTADALGVTVPSDLEVTMVDE